MKHYLWYFWKCFLVWVWVDMDGQSNARLFEGLDNFAEWRMCFGSFSQIFIFAKMLWNSISRKNMYGWSLCLLRFQDQIIFCWFNMRWGVWKNLSLKVKNILNNWRSSEEVSMFPSPPPTLLIVYFLKNLIKNVCLSLLFTLCPPFLLRIRNQK